MLQKKVASQQLLPDEHQQRVAEALEDLYQKVQTYEPKPRQSENAGGFSWFSFGKKEEKKTDAAPELKG